MGHLITNPRGEYPRPSDVGCIEGLVINIIGHCMISEGTADVFHVPIPSQAIAFVDRVDLIGGDLMLIIG